MRESSIVIILFLVFAIVTAAYVQRVPGLMGDEASEGENVWHMWDVKGLVYYGERSYIGPYIDYIRFPFVMSLGFTALPLRIVMWLFGLATFCLAVAVTRRWWGMPVGLMAAGMMFFSPIYLTQQRLGWAITLLPFFAWLVMYIAQRSYDPLKAGLHWLLLGFAAGLGVHNHVLFLPIVIALAVLTGGVASLQLLFLAIWTFKQRRGWGDLVHYAQRLWNTWPVILGFMAGIGTQLGIMLLDEPGEYVDVRDSQMLVGQRITDLPKVLPLVLSGSAFAARYTGNEFSPLAIMLILAGILSLIGLGFAIIWIRGRRSEGKAAAFLSVFLGLYLMILMYIVPRYTLRYFVVFVLGVWLLAGWGLGMLVDWLAPRLSRKGLPALVLAVGLTAWTVGAVLLPYLATGGSAGKFSLGNRTDRAAALVDIRPLLGCLRGKGLATSRDTHIYNRLRYLSHKYPDLQVPEIEEDENKVIALVEYRLPEKMLAKDEEFCPELQHFIVRPYAPKTVE